MINCSSDTVLAMYRLIVVCRLMDTNRLIFRSRLFLFDYSREQL